MEFVKAYTVEKQPGSTVKITGEIPFTELEKERASALKKLGADIEVDGFRKGHVPEKMLVERIGEGTLLSEMAERALAKVYPHILVEHSVDAIGYPQVEVTKLAPGNPLGFNLTIAVMPDITLPNYKQLASTVNKDKASSEVTDAEVDKQIEDIMRQKAAYERLQNKAAQRAEVETEVTDTADLPTPESEAKKATEKEDEEFDPAKIELPELTDEYVKTLGQPGQFESVADFKSKIREHLQIEKEREVHNAHRAKITDTIIEATKMDLPQILIDSELEQMLAQMNEDLKRANLEFNDYLNHIKKTQEELLAEWKPAAEKRAKLQLVLNEIAQKEEITPDEAQLQEQVDQLKEQYKDADEQRIRVYVASVMTNDAVMKMLEAQ